MIPVDRLNEFIMGAIKGKLEGEKPSYTYTKPYTQRIEDLKMPIGYQPLAFQQFDGKDNPRQHIAHFVETCNDAGTYGDLLFKQFVRSLKGTAFNWYTDLEPGCIDSWHDMEHEFLIRFYSTRRTVSFLELTTTHQRNSESSAAYIERWRELCLNCKEKISQSSAIEMCIQGMHFELSYILQGLKPKTFEELSSRAHDMELSITVNGGQNIHIQSFYNGGKSHDDVENGGKAFKKYESMDAMHVNIQPTRIFTKAIGESKDASRPLHGSRRLSYRKRQNKKYPFLDSDVPYMFHELLKHNLVDLLEMRRPHEASMVDDPSYCKYHRLVGHQIENCFVFKDKVMKLARDGRIELAGGTGSANQVSISCGKSTSLLHH
ncbi:PREDICTED: uncharacterized protein LOC109174830 [Ipomoea nil]|uniref:uncharacterized protein LOC109174830 n=1 Tax=Ipomoea nil TaxID=35883 RepID=UPI000900D543|nr:PREDICTED: uncharacterized protein LOC109174830 [Ipomoea nil]